MRQIAHRVAHLTPGGQRGPPRALVRRVPSVLHGVGRRASGVGRRAWWKCRAATSPRRPRLIERAGESPALSFYRSAHRA